MLTFGDLKELQKEYSLSDDTVIVVCLKPDENEDFRFISDEPDLESVIEYDGVVEIDPRGQEAVIIYPEISYV